MSSAAPSLIVNDRRPCWRVLRAMEADLRSQMRGGTLHHAGSLEDDGTIFVSGSIDLASLAHAAEDALRREFSR
ncbi:MAG: hypothetical protein KGJ57_17535 [Sphingomonadales bacterium]|nr:hypothetical protein [Sphingomonadales bacterium]MDE2171201.1 hypothetical protein [Sphingomonadales bacterium]